ncbi:hypothetical protein Tco_0237740 [Tanacetum coccineum]
MPKTNDPINTKNTTNVSQSVVDESLPQLLDSKGGSHVTNVPAFDAEDFTSEKVKGTLTRLKCLLNDLENNGVFIPQAEVNATFVNSLQRKWLSVNQSHRENNSIKNDSLATLIGTSNESMADLNAEYHEQALMANQKSFYKRSGRRIDDMTKGKSEKGKKEKEKSEKGLIVESFDWDDESVSSNDEGTTKIREFMAITQDEPLVGKVDARSGKWVDLTIKKVHRILSMNDGDERKQVLDYTHVDLLYVEDQMKNMVNKFNLLKQEISLHNRRKEKISSKEVVFTKADESSSMLAPEITSDSESKCDTREPLPPLPKLIGTAPTGTSGSLISLTDLTFNMADLSLTHVPKKTKPSVKVSPTYVIKKKTETLIPVLPGTLFL